MTAEIPEIRPVEVLVESGKTYWWCACGLSKSQPFCDGSHRGTSFSPVRYQASESAMKSFCVCKQTAAAPFCDGCSHLSAGSAKPRTAGAQEL
jgi:CDGSH iron-sulfur domain-containing protein 3